MNSHRRLFVRPVLIEAVAPPVEMLINVVPVAPTICTGLTDSNGNSDVRGVAGEANVTKPFRFWIAPEIVLTTLLRSREGSGPKPSSSR